MLFLSIKKMNCIVKLVKNSISISLIVSFSHTAMAEVNSPNSIERLTIVGKSNGISNIPGSVQVLAEKELATFDYSDIMRVLTSVPGVYVLEEDGYGLRPNIGMRGSGQNRSEKITVLEDNVLAAPAPYSAPSAYYFPTFGRIQQLEVHKGASSVLYGPRNIGGAINLLSRQIPEENLSGFFQVNGGQDGFAKIHTYVGGQSDNIGGLIEVFSYQADGFKDINQTEVDSGFNKNDVLMKTMFSSDAFFGTYQEIEFKLKYSDEKANETYMGLTNDDYQKSPYSRYAASQKDNIETEHFQFQVNHFVQLNSFSSIVTSLYFNDFNRNWYKASKIGGKGLSDGGIELAAMFDHGLLDEPLNVDLKANNRSYISKGLQSHFDFDIEDHNLKLGIRVHYDEMDRYQWIDSYSLNTDSSMTLTSAGVAGTDSNRIDSAEALSLFLLDEYQHDDLNIRLGFRFEDVDIKRKDWGKADPSRNYLPKETKNSSSAFLPSLGFTYAMTDNFVVLANVNKGFSPPAPGNESSEAEKSTNYEIGLRSSLGSVNSEAIVFYSDYKNMHGNCTVSQGCSDDNVGDQYNAGKVQVEGVELKLGYDFTASNIRFPINASYTYSKSRFKNSFESKFDTWGEVYSGFELPYIPENQLQLSLGAHGESWEGNLLFRYVGKSRSSAGKGQIPVDQLIEARTLLDFRAIYELSHKHTMSISVDNLLGKKYMVSRAHGSIMVGKPRSLILGYEYSF